MIGVRIPTHWAEQPKINVYMFLLFLYLLFVFVSAFLFFSEGFLAQAFSFSEEFPAEYALFTSSFKNPHGFSAEAQEGSSQEAILPCACG